MPIKILATADLHLGRKSSAIAEKDSEGSTSHTWNRIVDWAIENDVQVLLLAGDIIDEDNKFFEAIGPIKAGFDTLQKNNISVFLVTGNHDYDVLSEIIKNNSYDNVRLLGVNGNWEEAFFDYENISIRFYGWSFPQQTVRYDPMASLQPISDTDQITIGLLHGDVGTPDSYYGPVNYDNLKMAGADAWILGHIHKPHVFSKENPFIAYPGSPHAMDAGEKGKHGPVLLEVHSKNNIRTRTIPLSPVRYENLTIEMTPEDDSDDLRSLLTNRIIEKSAELLPDLERVEHLVFDVDLQGSNSAVNQIDIWKDQLVEDYQDQLVTGTQVTVRKIINNVQPSVENLEELAQNPSPAGKLAETILAIKNGQKNDFIQKLEKRWIKRQKKLNNESLFNRLTKDKRLPEPDEKVAHAYILRECYHLMNNLMQQKK